MLIDEEYLNEGVENFVPYRHEENEAQKQEPHVLGKYGHMRLSYLENHKRGEYESRVIDGSLHSHLDDIQERAQHKVDTIMRQMEERNPPPEQGTMAWVRYMNANRAMAEECVMDLIYS